MNEVNGSAPRYPVPPFLVGENPAHEQYHEATELFALFDYLKAQRFGVFSIRESLQAVGERIDSTLQGFHLSEQESWECIAYMASLGVGVIELHNGATVERRRFVKRCGCMHNDAAGACQAERAQSQVAGRRCR